MKIICYDIPELVKVRKNKVDIKGLQKLLKKHKNDSIKNIAIKLNKPKTEVEHWFRTDKCFSIPDSEIWLKLKKILNIKLNTFDNQIMEFEIKESLHEQSNRVYDVNGIAPTITSTSADIRILL